MFYEKLLTNALCCPECESQMKEAERREERGHVFIWFECSRPECKGQWLKKIPVAKTRIAG
jgi:hypothetical protein